MLHGLPSRRNTVKSFKSAFGLQEHQYQLNERSNQTLATVYLPASIPSMLNVSPGLWHWVTTSELSAEHPRVFTPAGEPIYDHLPPHLLVPYTPPASEKLAASRSTSSTLLSGYSTPKVARKSVDHDDYRVRRFFINIMSIQLKTQNYNNIICVIGIGDQKRTTSILHLQKIKMQKGTITECLEGFLFDVPADASDFVLSIHFYTKGSESSGIVSSPSISSMSSLSNLNFFKKQHSQMFNFNDKIPASPQSLGVFLGELSIVVPASHPFAKIPGSHAINSPKKEIGRLSIQMGIYDDYHYIPLPELPIEMMSYGDYLNFYLYTKGGLIWDKKWVVASTDGLLVYNAEYRENKDPIAWLPFKQLRSVEKANKEFMAAPNCMQLSISLPWIDDLHVFLPTEVSSAWKDQVAEAGLVQKNLVVVYITADSCERKSRWKDFLECHILRNRMRH
ncbi:hypothetical protein HDV01_000492 [Terramyces sp. JEL0728]|nr:hypothetical protein HDV01_000492 [Terramyces sp. JEL0728]